MWKRVSLLVLLAALLAALPVLLTERALRIAPERRTRPENSKALAIAGRSGAKWSEAEIAADDGVTLKGWTFLPAPERDAGKAVILLHGAGDSRRGMLGFAGFFAQRGYATLVVDSRGHGVSSGIGSHLRLAGKNDAPLGDLLTRPAAPVEVVWARHVHGRRHSYSGSR